MEQASKQKGLFAAGGAGAAENADLVTRAFRYILKSHYDECGLIETGTRRAVSLIRDDEAPGGLFLGACPEDFDEGVRRLMDMACTEDDKKALSSLLLESMIPELRRNGSLGVRCCLRGADGSEARRLVECVFFGEGEAYILLLSADIRESESSRQRLVDAVEEAQAASRAKSAFIANMSHEIRTPMNAIVGISEVLLRKELPPDVLDSLSTIQNSGSSLLGIINDILDFSKIETGKFEITEVEYMLPSLLMDISNVISVRLVSKPVFFLMDIDPSLPNYLVGDDIRVKQILMNLLGNAVKFTQEGSIILYVRGGYVEDGRFELRFEVRDSGIGIREEDIGKLFESFSQVDTRKNRGTTGTGLGLAISRNLARLMGGDLTVSSVYGHGSSFMVRFLQEVPRYIPLGSVRDKSVCLLICEQNERLTQGLASVAENLGLRYEICRETDKLRKYEGITHVLIRRRAFLQVQDKLNFMFNRGNILLILDNNEQPESAFMDYKQLQLPLVTLQLINALNGDEIISSIKKKSFDRSQIVPLTFARVLVVDDNATNLQVAQGLMLPYQMRIDVCSSGFEAIEMVQKERYNAVFMDHMMPEMDGIEAARLIRSLPGEYYQSIPIIALTANAMSDAREQFLQAGMNDFVAKPIEMRELHRVVKKYIQSQAPAGYLEKIKREQDAGSGEPKRNPGAVLPGTAAADPAVSAASDALPPDLLVSPDDPGVLGQLLLQNSALLEQNRKLLLAIAGHSAPSADGAGQADRARSPRREDPDAGAPAPSEGPPDPIPGVDMEKSLGTYGGSIEIYHSILRTYYSDLREKAALLPELFEKRDTENFTIQVHALKSASRSVGAFALGDAAYQLELAGKAGDWEAIEGLFPGFREDMDQMAGNIGLYVEKNLPSQKRRGPFLEKFDPELLAGLRASCEEMDYLRVEDILKKLRENEYPEALDRRLDEMCECCEAFDYDKLETLITEL